MTSDDCQSYNPRGSVCVSLTLDTVLSRLNYGPWKFLFFYEPMEVLKDIHKYRLLSFTLTLTRLMIKHNADT